MRICDFTTLTFDVAGTLIDFETGILNWFKPHLKALGLEKTEDEILTGFAGTEAKYLRLLPQSSFTEILPVIYSDMLSRWGLKPKEKDGERFQLSVRQWPPFPDTVDALEELGRYFRLVAVTNSDQRFLKYMSANMGNPFDDAFTCDRVGVNKPDKRLFQAVLKSIAPDRIDAGEILHVAQSQFHDIIPVTELGWATVWIHRRHNQPGFGATPEPYTLVQPTFHARSMAEFARQFKVHRQEDLRNRSGTFSLMVKFNPTNSDSSTETCLQE